MRFWRVLSIAAAVLLMASEAAAQGRWRRAESAHFIVYSEGGEADLREAVMELERFDATLRMLTQHATEASENKLEIYLLRDRSGLRRVWPDAPATVAGFYGANAEQIAAFSVNRDQGIDARTILFHEYAHHFMFQYFDDAYPAWFTEGFAEYVSTADLTARRTRLGGYEVGRTQPLFDLAWADMEDILDPDREGARRVRSYMFYSQSWLNVHYILSDVERRRAFSRYMNAIKHGGDRLASFEAAFGTSLEEWRDDLTSYMRRGIVLQDFPPASADASIEVTRLPEAADDLLLLLARARRPVPEDEREDLAARLIAAASRHPGDAYASQALARAEIIRNQYAAARPILEAMIAAHPQDVEGHYLMGLTYLRESEAEGLDNATRFDIAGQGRPHFVRAFRLNANHVPTLYAYVRTFGAPMEEETLEVLLRAQELAPQVQEISFAAATALMYAGAHQQAAPMLRSIAYNRHAGSLRRYALITLEAALAGQDPPPPPPPEPEEEEAD